MSLCDSSCTEQRSLNMTTSGKTFSHMQGCQTKLPTMEACHRLWMNSMQIPLDSVKEYAEVPGVEIHDAAESDTREALANGPQLSVHLLLKVGANPTVEDTVCCMKIEISPTCTKEFVFTPGVLPNIPASVLRPTSVTVTCEQAGTTVSVETHLMDGGGDLITSPENIIIECKPLSKIPKHALYTKLETDDRTLVLKFPCFQYGLDVKTSVSDYDLRRMREDMTALQDHAAILPSTPVTHVSMKDAKLHLANLEKTWQQLENTLQDCQTYTTVQELGFVADDAQISTAKVNWQLSYCAPKDSSISAMYPLARSFYYQLTAASNMSIADALDDSLNKDIAAGDDRRVEVCEIVKNLLMTRCALSNALQARRVDLDSVLRVRVNFLMLEAIDDALRRAYGEGGDRLSTSSNSSFVADDIACHDYWLGQMKSNMHNSVKMHDLQYDTARDVLDKCKHVRDSGVILAPSCGVQLSRLGCKVWQNMLLQGITVTHSFRAASAPHFMYKKQMFVDYEQHPILQAVKGQQCTATQIQSAKLLAILVSRDVEHRIITPNLKENIICDFTQALSSTVDDNHARAKENLLARFENPLQSLVMSALGKSPAPDLTFLTDAALRPPTSGYDMTNVTEFLMRAIVFQQP